MLRWHQHVYLTDLCMCVSSFLLVICYSRYSVLKRLSVPFVYTHSIVDSIVCFACKCYRRSNIFRLKITQSTNCWNELSRKNNFKYWVYSHWPSIFIRQSKWESKQSISMNSTVSIWSVQHTNTKMKMEYFSFFLFYERIPTYFRWQYERYFR